LARCAGSGIFTRRSISIVLASAADFDKSWCSRNVSLIWAPIVMTGLSEVIGSWKIIEISLPRTSRIAASSSARMSLPSSLIEPVAQGGAEQIDAETDETDRQARENHQPWRGPHVLGRRFRQHAAPGRVWLGDPEAEERQGRLGQDRRAELRRRQHDQRRQRV